MPADLVREIPDSEPGAPVEQKHHPLSASKAPLWIRCSGYHALAQQAPPDTTSVYAAEGTAAHKCAEEQLAGFLATGRVIEHPLGAKLKADGYDFEFDHSMREAVRVYVNFVQGLMQLNNVKPKDVTLETRVEIPTAFEEKYPDIGPLAGHLDIQIKVVMNCLYIGDYKHGKGVPVDVEDNYQLQFYALGAWLALPLAQRKLIDQIHTFICQPRVYTQGGIKLWTYTPEQIEVEFYGKLKAAVNKIVAGDYELVAGEHCRNYFCQNRTICKAYQDYAKNVPIPARYHANRGGASDFADITIPEVTRAVVKIPVHELSNEQLSALVIHGAELENLIKLAKAEATKRITEAIAEKRCGANGAGVIPGLRMGKKRSDREWGENADIVRAKLADGFSQDVFEPRVLLTPPALEKAHPKLYAMVEDLVVKPDNGMTLEVEKRGGNNQVSTSK